MTSPADTGRADAHRPEKGQLEQIAAPAHPWSVRAEGEVVRIHEERAEPWTSFDGFFEAEHERLYKALYFVTGSRQDAEELMQDAFLKLWERWDQVHTIDDPTGYLFRVALNGFRMRRRHAAVAVRRSSPAAEDRDDSATPRCVPTCVSCCWCSHHDSVPRSCSSTCWSTPPTRRRASSASVRPPSDHWPPRRDKPCERRKGCEMPDVNQLFRAATQNARPASGALERQLKRQHRQARNRKMSALAAAAIIVAAIALFAANALNRGKDGSAPGTKAPSGRDSGLTFTVVGTDGSVRSIIPVAFGTLHSDVSPDGTSVAFTLEMGLDSQIATMRLDGTQLHILTSDSLDADRPRWSPDGSQLVFSEGSDSTGRRLMVMDADGANVQEISGTWNSEDVPADWSPDGSLILYTSLNQGGRDLATVSASGGDYQPLASARDVDEGPGTWSPDGSMIVYTRSENAVAEIWVMDADGGGQHLLAALPGKDASAPEWSPDGSAIAFIGTVRGNEQLPGADSVYVVDVATGNVTKILHGIANYATYDSRATWLPAGDAVLVLTDSG